MENQSTTVDKTVKISLIKTSFLIWLFCVVVVTGIIGYIVIAHISHKTPTDLPSVLFFTLAGFISLGVLSFGIGSIGVLYKILSHYIKSKKLVILLVGIPIILFIGFAGIVAYNVKNYNYNRVLVKGTSMTQFGYYDGEYLPVTSKACTIGDVCVFRCLSDKCKIKNNPDVTFIKNLISTENECYFFEGNTWKVDATHPSSFDSHDYGCLKPFEFQVTGVVTSTANRNTKIDDSSSILPDMQQAGKPNNDEKIETVEGLMNKISKLIKFSKEDLDPVMATVTSETDLTGLPFYAKVQVGDELLVFKKSGKNILYRPSTNEIINIGIVNPSKYKE